VNDLKYERICKVQKLYLDGLGMDKSEREIYSEYRAIKEKEICQACPKCLVDSKNL
jgi:hypothetical protein